MQTGKLFRFPELFQEKPRIILAPVDDSLISGPIGGLEDPNQKIRRILEFPDAGLLAFRGTIERHRHNLIGRRTILNVSASTTRSAYTHKVLLGSVEQAIVLGASAIAIHVNISSKHASTMLQDAGSVIEAANRFGIPVVGIMYPRGEKSDGSVEEFDSLREDRPAEFSDLIAHCVRIGFDLGVDLIKTQFLLDASGYRKLSLAAEGTPIVIAGGPLIGEGEAISRAIAAVQNGMAGISFARNVFGREDPLNFYKRLKRELNW